MKQEITVDKALKRYYLKNNIMYTIDSIAIAVLIALAVFIYNYYSGEYVLIISILFTLINIVQLIIFSIRLSNMWKFQTFSRVKNVHELKKRLILLGEISGKEIFFRKIENCTENDNKYWKIHLKFSQEDTFVDDKTIPKETFIYYSKAIYITTMLLSIPFFALGIHLIVMAVDVKRPIVALPGIFFLVFAIILGYFHGYKKLKNRKPQLILNNEGIYSNKKGFHKWEEIRYYYIITGRIHIHSNGFEYIDTKYLNIKNNGIKLSKLLIVYQERNKLKKLF